MKYVTEAVLFDVDGTLINNLPILTEGVRQSILRHLGRDVLDKEILREAKRSLPDFLRTLLPEDCSEPEALLKEVRTDFEAFYAKHSSEAPLFDGIKDALRELSGNYRLGTASSRLSNVSLDLARLGIGSYFEATISRQDTTHHKPHPEPLLLGARRLATLPGNCAYVGDANADISAAKAAGMKAVAVTYGGNEMSDLVGAEPDVFVPTPYDLTMAIRNIRNKEES